MTPDHPLADVVVEDEQWVLRFERRLSHPPERVWAAITESEHLEHWLPCDIVGPRQQGAEVTLLFWPEHLAEYGVDEAVPLTGRIRVWDPPATFEWTWDTEVLRFDLVPTDDGTTLRLATWLAPEHDQAWRNAVGWHVCLDHLVELVETGSTEALADSDLSALEPRYGELFAARA